jgi:Putative zinc-finger
VRCDQARMDVSLAADGELAGERAGRLADHLAGCAACAAFQAHLAAIRQQLRLEPVGAVPDVAPRVLAAVRQRARPAPAGSGQAAAGPPTTAPGPSPVAPARPARGRRPGRLLPVAAAFLAGAVVGATFVGLGGRRPSQVALADLPARVVAAQRTLTSLAAEVSLVERNWHPDVPERVFTGRLRYRAPESLALRLTDRTAYPSAAWVRDDVTLVVTGDRWWTRGPRGCPVEAQPGCTPRSLQARLVQRREPFADATPVPLDLVTPVRSFTPAAAPAPLGTRRVGGRAAEGVATTAAQVAPLLAGLAPAGNLRAFHPTDPVELWLDQTALIPLALRVTVAPGGERQRWAAAHGYQDRPGQAVLDLTLRGVVLNRPLAAGAFPPPPAGTRAEDAGFRDGPAPGTAGAGGTAPAPAWLPAGFRPYRSGVVGPGGVRPGGSGGPQGGPPEGGRPKGCPGGTECGPRVAVRSWTDGRAWVKVRATRTWPGGRLFGDLGPLVRPLALGAGVAYASEDGGRVAVHGDGVDLVVGGSLAPDDLVRVAASLPVAGRPVPAGWAEAATATLSQARAASPGLLRPRDPAGFAPPAVRVDGRVVTLAYAGPGSRGFLLVQAPGTRLVPPLDADARGVRVRRSDGRWSAERGQLEWVERGRVLDLRSATLSLEELLAIAASLEPA